ncbi:MAG: heparinase II/III family protein [Gemmatimonadetes bacterium]|nr:heparinase II/III family protein [Gemmatimonadota bacterium]
MYEGERHHRAWVWRYHLWLTERAIHLALLEAMGVKEGAGQCAADIVNGYAERYRDYPNVDNVLGPTRLFFSTYLESIWLIQLVIATSLLESMSVGVDVDAVKSVVEESASIIASFDEGWSNRQVWNNAALIAAGCWLDDPDLVTRGLSGAHGIAPLLTDAVSAGGRWHEGENYHFFALRGFQLAGELLRSVDVNLYDDDPWNGRLGAMYAAPLQSVLPDLSVPARGDSPYGVSLLQARFAELWEIGWARTGDPRLEGALAAIYASDAPPGEEHGFEEIAEVEQNREPQHQSRHDLGWKALLWMRADPPVTVADWHEGSVLVDSTGPAILRSGSDRYVSLECAGTGMGHGHPDRQHLTIYWGYPWLMDFGTGSYVAESLHWYRSTLAHNAPGLAGVGQVGGETWCSAFDHRGEWGWAQAVADRALGPDTRVTRSVISCNDYLVDVVEVSAPPGCVVDLAIHPLGAIEGVEGIVAPAHDFLPAEGARARARAGAGHETGYDKVEDVRALSVTPERIRSVADQQALDILLVPRSEETCFLMRAPGPPGLALGDTRLREFVVRRASGSGTWVQVYAPSAVGLSCAEIDANRVRIVRADGSADTIILGHGHVRIEGAHADVELTGSLPPATPRSRPAPGPAARLVVPCALLEHPPNLAGYFDELSSDTIVELGKQHYRRSEADYPGYDKFRARLAFGAHGESLYVGIDVRKDDLIFRERDAPDPRLDNETPDIHSDGVQFYVDVEGWRGFVVIPEPGADTVRVEPVAGTSAEPGQLSAKWETTSEGYALLLRFDAGALFVDGSQVLVQVVVNEMRSGRVRRAGQLAVAAGGGWTYLRGDRESPDNAAILEIK